MAQSGILYTHISSLVGPIWIAATETGLCAIQLGEVDPDRFFTWLRKHIGPDPVRKWGQQAEAESEDAPSISLASATMQLQEYFAGTRRDFALPLDTRGTPFQKAVWAAVRRIPYGTTATYGQIAGMIGHPRAARAVGRANGANPLPIVIPCHRVVGTNGSLVGYGAGLHIKATLLRLEKVLLV